VFDYSDEDGTEAASLPDKVSAGAIKKRYDWMSALAEELCAQRAGDRVGSTVEVLIDSVERHSGGIEVEGRAAHQAPEVDGSTTLVPGGAFDPAGLHPGDLVRARVTESVGVDLVATPIELISPATP
jgi:ribosomal protein S12 methylthiotransferase